MRTLKNRLNHLRSPDRGVASEEPGKILFSALADDVEKCDVKTAYNKSENSTRVVSSSQLISERIKRTGRKRNSIEANKFKENRIEERIGGKVISDGVVLFEKKYPLNRIHGKSEIGNISNEHLSCFLLSEELDDNLDNRTDPYDIVFMDTETTGLSGGSGTLVFLLGIARIENSELISRQYFLTAYAGERAMLQHAADWISSSRYLVTYNGKSFDAPLLASRYRLSRLTNPFEKLLHVDLLHHTRRVFGYLWDNCRLATIENKLLHFHRKDDLPGSEAPYVWFEFIRYGHVNRVQKVVEHNYWDLISLASLLKILHIAYQRPSEMNGNINSIAKYYIDQKKEEMAYDLLQKNQHTLTEEGALILAKLHGKRKNWHDCISIWEKLAERRCSTATEHLAKFYEHKSRDFSKAIEYTKILMLQEAENINHKNRFQRLIKKQNNGS